MPTPGEIDQAWKVTPSGIFRRNKVQIIERKIQGDVAPDVVMAFEPWRIL